MRILRYGFRAANPALGVSMPDHASSRMGGHAAVNVAGPFYRNSGFGTHARGVAAALDAFLPTALIDTALAGSEGALPPPLDSALRRPPNPGAPTIVIGPARPPAAFPGAVKIAWFAWETSLIPEAYAAPLRAYDEVWAPSMFCAEIVKATLGDAVPVRVIPEGVDADEFHPAAEGRRANGEFAFLGVGKLERRKAHELAIQAFLDQFGEDDAATLMLHLTPSIKDDSGALAALHAMIAEAPMSMRRKLRLSTARTDSLAELYRAADSFILPTRSEAWGLPIIEAMASGLPCIVTAHGGHLDYCTDQNVFLCRVAGEERAFDPIYFPEKEDWGNWARPDREHLGALMRRVFENPEAAACRGSKACNDIRNGWTWSHSARRVSEALADLGVNAARGAG